MPMRREQVAAALRYLQDKADLRGRFERATSLDPQEQDLADIAVETGASLVPGVGPALAARDFERARRADDEAGMAMAAAGAIPGGKLAKLLKGFDPTRLELDVYHGTPHRFPATEANPLGEFDASKIGTGEGAQALEAASSKAAKAEPQPFGVQGYLNDDLRRVKQNFFSQYGVEENKQFSKDYEVVELAKLKPSENTNESKIQSLMKTMREEGNARDNPIPPIIVDSEGNILDGHHRYEAAKRLGAKYVPIVELFDKRKGPVFSE